MRDGFAFLAAVLVFVGSLIQAVHAAFELARDMVAVEASDGGTRRDRRALRQREAWEAYGWSFITLGAIAGMIGTWP